MSRRAVRFIPAYLLLLLALAGLGGWNQHLLDRELSLIETRERVRAQVVDLRARAAAVRGPLAVARWAQDHGMVPAPEVDRAEQVMPLRAPELGTTETGLEVRTVWR